VHNTLLQYFRLVQSEGLVKFAKAIFWCYFKIRPNSQSAHMALGRFLLRGGRFTESVNAFLEALKINPHRPSVHKDIINALATTGEHSDVLRFYQLERKDSRDLHVAAADVSCCISVRNEELRLPYLLSFYRAKGISNFFIIDNDSTDGTLAFLLTQPDVYVWQTRFEYSLANFGTGWLQAVMRTYCQGRWCLLIDADEIFYYPSSEHRTIRELCDRLEQQNKKAMGAILLDMYSQTPIDEAHYVRGQNFLEVCPYFDKTFYHQTSSRGGPWKNQTAFRGGLRRRIFGSNTFFLLNKVPLIKYDANTEISGGQHFTNIPPAAMSSCRGALLHFKYFSTFPADIAQEVERKQHWNKAADYVTYQKGLDAMDTRSFFHPDHSVKFEGSEQLIRLGIMQTGK